MSLFINGVEAFVNIKVGGTWTVLSGTWTIPAVTLGGALAVNGQQITSTSIITLKPANASNIEFRGTQLNIGQTLRLQACATYNAEDNTLASIVFDVDALTGTDRRRGGILFNARTIGADIPVLRLDYNASAIFYGAVTLGGNMTVTGYAFDAGAGSAQINTTGVGKGLGITSTQDGATGVLFDIYHETTTPAQWDIPFDLRVYSKDGETPAVKAKYFDMMVKVANIGSGTEQARLDIEMMDAGAEGNSALILTGAGLLSVDVTGATGTYANVDLFDEYDDAPVLRQGIQQNNRELLADMGILERKDTGSGYMMKVQPMIRLLAGGIYQSRAMIDSLQEKVAQLESKLMLLEARNG